MKSYRKLLLGLALLIISGIAGFALTDGVKWGHDYMPGRHFAGQIWVDGAAYIGGTATIPTATMTTAGITTANITTGNITNTNAGILAGSTGTFSAGISATTGLFSGAITGQTTLKQKGLITADGGLTTTGTLTAATTSAGALTGTTAAFSSTLSAKSTTVNGNLITTGTAAITGVATAAGFTIGSAAIIEAELETINTITAGTAVANKAAILGPTYNLDQLAVANLSGTSTNAGALTGTTAVFSSTLSAKNTTVNGNLITTGTSAITGLSTLTGGAKIGSAGTPILESVLGTLTFAGDSSKTATVPSVASVSGASGYYVGCNFQTNSANAYVQTAAISSTTLTATPNAATTGTLVYRIDYF